MYRAIKIVSACPKDFMNMNCWQNFGAQQGFVITKPKDFSKWNGQPMNAEEAKELRLALEFLHKKNAFFEFKFNTKHTSGSSMLDQVIDELSLGYSDLQFAICTDKPTPLKDPQKVGVVSLSSAIANDLLIHESPKPVKMEPQSLCLAMTQAAFKGTIFKIIDPWIFEMKYDAQSRVDFIIELCKQLERHNTFAPHEVTIEVYGIGEKKKFSVTESDIIDQLRGTTHLKEAAQKYSIQFIALSEKLHGERLHRRYFLNDHFIIQLEDSFHKRKEAGKYKEQEVWCPPGNKRDEIDRFYDPYTQTFDVCFRFYADDIWDFN